VRAVLCNCNRSVYSVEIFCVIVILICFFSGFRYELYCVTKSAQTPHCLVSNDVENFKPWLCLHVPVKPFAIALHHTSCKSLVTIICVSVCI